MALRARSSVLTAAVLLLGAYGVAHFGAAFVAPPQGAVRRPTVAHAAAAAALLGAAPMPAHAGGMFDFGLTLPFVMLTFLLMMLVLNALWYSPVSTEQDERNKKLLETLSLATDKLAMADTIQVAYTVKIRETRETARVAVSNYKMKLEATLKSQVTAAEAANRQEVAALKKKLTVDSAAKIAAADAEVNAIKAKFVTETLATYGL